MSPINDVVLGFLWWVVPIAIVTVLFKSPWFKGLIGELIVNLSAKLLLDKKAYRLIKNVTLATEDGTTQIDHLIISTHGVFVVETKHMRGWIYGEKSQSDWTQKNIQKIIQVHESSSPKLQACKSSSVPSKS